MKPTKQQVREWASIAYEDESLATLKAIFERVAELAAQWGAEQAQQPMTEPTIKAVKNPDGSIENFMPKVNGKSFRCNCGCNVFHKPDDKDPDLYECNACGAWFESA